MGAVNIDNTGSGSAVTLSSDGTDLLLNGSPIGGGGASPITISNKTGAYTVVAGDLGTIINCTSGTFTVSLTAAATLGSGFNCWIWNTGTGAITIDPNSTETIDGLTTLILYEGEGAQIICDGTNWQTGDKKTMRGYAEKISASDTRPVATGSTSVAVGAGSTSSGNFSYAGGYLATASGLRSLALGRLVTASSTSSTAIGANSGSNGSQAVTGSGAMALGGSYASGTDSFAAAVANNTSTYGATGANSVAIGYQAISSGTYSTSVGGQLNTASANYASVFGGRQNTASGAYSFCSGWGNEATSSYAIALGNYSKSSVTGKFSVASGRFNATGDAQKADYVLRSDTTDATAEALTTNNTAPGTDDQVILPNNSAYAFTGTVVARQQASGGTASAAWKIEGLIRREANAGTTTLVASTVTAIDNTPGWTLALSADTTNGGLKVEATGAAATNIRWVATVQTSEVTYA